MDKQQIDAAREKAASIKNQLDLDDEYWGLADPDEVAAGMSFLVDTVQNLAAALEQAQAGTIMEQDNNLQIAHAEVQRLAARLAAAEEREQKLRNELEFYADIANWDGPCGSVARDGGDRARAVLHPEEK